MLYAIYYQISCHIHDSFPQLVWQVIQADVILPANTLRNQDCATAPTLQLEQHLFSMHHDLVPHWVQDLSKELATGMQKPR